MKRAAEESSRGLEKKNPSSTPEEENKSSSTASKKEEGKGLWRSVLLSALQNWRFIWSALQRVTGHSNQSIL